MGKKSSRNRAGHMSRLRSERMNISYWEITGITVPTAGICRSEMSEGIKLSAGHGSGYGLLTGLDLSGTDNGMVERILRLVKG